ncbi:ER-golgi trafficking TRAPP I complex 85 kDa subunit-domain-containing protein [Cantharellus anzutake]|uniref:ER-golgi trafficking TRAPP I complex 85 kDa subunit-domain-containing protein n=1 Tax=Cantharellus anzutake TaxID=1750568 RepID=UPI001908A681|nr:ER-golgi trafficking TRAPP I complex 85 kDa subunit-domain-containing protein [Cantharellus anzutake]KAF8324689.1 ER-golgi trafficking TRAPP I complex 85 kDa subunit-domain-containing protein [Cantharellus anzutake]
MPATSVWPLIDLELRHLFISGYLVRNFRLLVNVGAYLYISGSAAALPQFQPKLADLWMSTTVPTLPHSLAPHILIHASPDVENLLLSPKGLPPLPELLSAFAHLSQVTTRTSTLSQVTHPRFQVKFSSLVDVEEECREDEERRTSRIIDWIGGRIAQRASTWLGDAESRDRERWWDDVKACADSDRTPCRTEGWNHPVALILATSTLAPNPLQAITALHARTLDLPSWVDTTLFRYTLIIHPTPSNLNPDEAVALLNAVKKQFDLNTHLLQLPSSLEKVNVRIPFASSRLSPPLDVSRSPEIRRPKLERRTVVMEITMSETDAQNTQRFVREFVTVSLIPWMERYVIEWNNAFSSTRRLPSRLLSSTTRRIFGSSSPAPTSSVANGIFSLESQTWMHRRLAEFSTILGDYKLASLVWETLRKDFTTGSDVLPLILAPASSLSVYATAALQLLGLNNEEVSAAPQYRALLYAVRWEIGIPQFASIDGERWLAMAAGNAEEPFSALLLARAASLSSRRGAKRRAALWYTLAAKKLERSGVKPLTIYFFQQASDAHAFRKEVLLSPSFFEIEAQEQDPKIDPTQACIQHALGRLKYSSGDTTAAIKLFLKLLSPQCNPFDKFDNDRMYVEDFRLAFEHYLSTNPETPSFTESKLPLNVCLPSRTRVRFSSRDVSESSVWTEMQERWTAYQKTRGDRSALDLREFAEVGEPFWIDLALCNPLDTEMNLTGLTLEVECKDASKDALTSVVQIEIIESVFLNSKERTTVPIKATPLIPTSLKFINAHYSFLSLLRTCESLAVRGKRLNDTPAQRQGNVRAPDAFVVANVRHPVAKLEPRFDDTSINHEDETTFYCGEIRNEYFEVENTGKLTVNDIWVVLPWDGSIRIKDDGDLEHLEKIAGPNTLAPPQPYRLSSGPLTPGASIKLPIQVYFGTPGAITNSILVVYREDENSLASFVAKATRTAWVETLLTLRTHLVPSLSLESEYTMMLEIENLGGPLGVQVRQVGGFSPSWCLTPAETPLVPLLAYRQLWRLVLPIHLVPDFEVNEVVAPTRRLIDSLASILAAQEPSPPECVKRPVVTCSTLLHGSKLSTQHRDFVWSSHRIRTRNMISTTFPTIPMQQAEAIFPFYSGTDMDICVLWGLPGTARSGQIDLTNLIVGVQHGALNRLLSDITSSTKVSTREMYAETARERESLVEAISASPWNVNDDPLRLDLQFEPVQKHDFELGKPYIVPVTFRIRNFSFQFSARFSLNTRNPSHIGHPQCQYLGLLTHHGVVVPSSHTLVTGRAIIFRPGLYSLPPCELKINVGYEQDGVWHSVASFVQSGVGQERLEVSSMNYPIISN